MIGGAGGKPLAVASDGAEWTVIGRLVDEWEGRNSVITRDGRWGGGGGIYRSGYKNKGRAIVNIC